MRRAQKEHSATAWETGGYVVVDVEWRLCCGGRGALEEEEGGEEEDVGKIVKDRGKMSKVAKDELDLVYNGKL